MLPPLPRIQRPTPSSSSCRASALRRRLPSAAASRMVVPRLGGARLREGVRDQLAFIARYVDLIEINNTFYRPPEAKNADSWVRRTALPGFLFSAKLHQDVTHRFTIEASTIAAFREGLEPTAPRAS